MALSHGQINRTIDIVHDEMTNKVVSRLTINRKTIICYLFVFFGIAFLMASYFPPRIEMTIEIEDVTGKGSMLVYKENTNSILRNYFTEWHVIDSETESVTFHSLHYDLNSLRIDVDGVQSVDIKKIVICTPFATIKEYQGKTLINSIGESQLLNYKENNNSVSFFKEDGEDSYFIINDYSFGLIPCLKYCSSIVLFSLLISVLVLILLNWLRISEMIVLSVCSVIIISFLCSFANGSYGLMEPGYLTLTYLIHLSILTFAVSLTSLKTGVFIANTFISLIYIANSYVERFRGRSFLISDLFAVKTALNVAGKYNWIPLPSAVLVLLLSIAFSFLLFLGNFTKIILPIKKRLSLLAIAAMMMIFALSSEPYKTAGYSSWDTDIVYFYKKQGVIASMIKYNSIYRVKKPAGYTHASATNILSSVAEDNNHDTIFHAQETQPDNIIMIMNESFSNIERYCSDLDFSTTPYLDSISENIIRGNLLVSVKGGGTCNTEFEALTGLSMFFLPANSYPFQSYMRKNIPSIADFFASQDFEVSSLHLENANNWNRLTAYTNLGLLPFYSIDDYSNVELLRGRASDISNYKALIDIENGIKSDRSFLFNVTIQNHGGYGLFSGVNKAYDLSEYGYHPTAEVYFSLMKLSDEAIRFLVEYYKSSSEKTMIILFGDHQPTLSENTEEWIFKNADSHFAKYCTPFYIITNYPIESKNIGSFSANYIPYIVASASGYELDPFLNFLGKIYKKAPVITQYGVIDSEGNYYAHMDETNGELNQLLHDYSIIEFDRLFGRE